MFMGMHFYWFERSGNIDMGRKLFGSLNSFDLGRGITLHSSELSEICYSQCISYRHTLGTVPHTEGPILTGKD